MATALTPTDSPELREYLLNYLRALKLGAAPPERPGHLTGVDRYLRRVEEEVTREKRARSRRRVGCVKKRQDLGPGAFEIPGYRLGERIGEGRFGTVFKAVDEHGLRGQIVAVKIFKRPIPDSNLSDDLWEGVFGEAKKSEHLRGVNVVKYLSHGIVTLADRERRAYIVWEYVDGESLHTRVERELKDLPGGRGRFRRNAAWRDYQRRAAGRLVPVALAAHAAHVGRPSHGVVGFLHCDIKPSNILLGARGEVYLSDFGLALNQGEFGVRGGTPGYTAPEMRAPGSAIGPSADVYSLGATLHHALFGRPPSAPSDQPPAAEGPIHRDLDAVRRKCLDPAPAMRYGSARDVAEDLRRFLANEPVKARRVSPPEWVLKYVRRRPAAAAAAAVTAACLTAVLVLGYSQSVQAQRLQGFREALAYTLPLVELADPEAPTLDGDVPQAARHKVSAGLIPCFDRLAELKEGDGATRAARAEALVSRARLRHALGKPEDDKAALDDLDRAGAAYRELPPTVDREVGLAGAALTRLAILGPQGRYAEGIATLDPVVAAMAAVVNDSPGRPDIRFRLARALGGRANCNRFLAAEEVGHDRARALELLNNAEADFKSAIVGLGALVEDAPAGLRERCIEWLSRTHGNFGLFLIDPALPGRGPGAAAEAKASFEKAVALAEDLTQRFPQSVAVQDAMVAAVVNLGEGLQAMSLSAEAAGVFERAAALYDRLRTAFPDNREFVWGQALARGKLGVALFQAGNPADALRVLAEARDRYDKLHDRYPEVRDIANERSQLMEFMQTSLGTPANPIP